MATTAALTPTTAAPDEDAPQRIVSLAPTHTETLFAIGAGPQVVAVDDQSNYPADALAVQTDLSGFTPNVEAIAAYEPDLVVTSGDDTLTAQLEAVGLTVWAGPSATTFDEAYAQIEQLGAATGHIAEAAELVGQMQTDLEALAGSLPTSEVPLTVFHELSTDGYSASSATFIGQVYALFGLRNIADAAEDASGYPQLNAETIIQANPDLIFLADTKCCGESAETVAARDGWDQITAVRDGNVFAMDDDVASRWGPRSSSTPSRCTMRSNRSSSPPADDRAASFARSEASLGPHGARRRRPLVRGGPSRSVVVAVIAGVMIGPAGPGAWRIPLALLDHLPLVSIDSGVSDVEWNIVWQVRMPRVLLGGLVGSMLALAGASYQGVFRNPLVEPYLLGAAAGAGLGATLVFTVMRSATRTGPSTRHPSPPSSSP